MKKKAKVAKRLNTSRSLPSKSRKKQRKIRPLTLEVAPNILEHLGLNLYTDLARGLVEFVANAYDADAEWVEIKVDIDAIAETRRQMRIDHKARQEKGEEDLEPLEEAVLPSHLTIEIVDNGHGMTRDSLQERFLRIARKRRVKDGNRSPGGRVVMGRKGIGKLAAFGVAQRVEVTTLSPGAKHATRVYLDYRDLVGKDTTQQIKLKEEMPKVAECGIEKQGTRIVLSDLVYAPTGSHEKTIKERVAEHFYMVKQQEFEIWMNGKRVPPFKKKFEFAYPDDGTPKDQLIDKTLTMENGEDVRFQYRIRFTQPDKHLSADQRGIRVYARNRLQSRPELLDIGTGMHGFNNTHYLDGIVVADFIDDRRTDYIASNRQSLRWDTELLSGLKQFLVDEMRDACSAYQHSKEPTLRLLVRKDDFTIGVIEKADLPAHRRDTAFKIAAKLAAGCPNTLDDSFYQESLPVIVHGLGYGEILSALHEISQKDHPSVTEVVQSITQLTKAEWDDFSKIVSGRLRAIENLEKIVQDASFAKPENESEIHRMLETSPWLIDPTFWQFLTSDETEDTIAMKLAQELEIGEFAPPGYDPTTPQETGPYKQNKRPDLVFLLANFTLGRIVIVELKSSNTPLTSVHLDQLQRYMGTAKEFISRMPNAPQLKVEGYLIGCRDKTGSQKQDVINLRNRERDRGPSSDWQVFDLQEVLVRTHMAHKELRATYQRAAKAAQEAECQLTD